MASIALQPIRMREAMLHVEADSYEQQINEVRFVPQAGFDWDRGEAAQYEFPHPAPARWLLQLGFVQDLATPNSLTTYLLEHTCQDKVVTFTVPGIVVAATVLIMPAAFGGTINQIPVATATLPMYGPPDMTPEAA